MTMPVWVEFIQTYAMQVEINCISSTTDMDQPFCIKKWTGHLFSFPHTTYKSCIATENCYKLYIIMCRGA